MIGVIFIGDIVFCPYIERYIDILLDAKVDFEVLYWNREEMNVQYPDNYIAYKARSELNNGKLKKVFDFFGYAIWLNKNLRQKKYEKLILLSSLSGFLVLPNLVKKYKKKYIFDIRDYSYENYKLYYLVEKFIIKQSSFTCISSEGFKKFLPKDIIYIVTDNFNPKELQYVNNISQKSMDQTINIVWLGSVRYLEHQSNILDELAKDKRFKLYYHGIGPQLEEYKQYCSARGYDDVVFTGKYTNDLKAELLKDADILNNSYGKKNEICIKFALSNKYYDGLIYGVPQLVEKDSYKGELVKCKKVGISLDIKEKKLGDKIFDYYHSINQVEFNKACKDELKRILMNDNKYMKKVEMFLYNE